MRPAFSAAVAYGLAGATAPFNGFDPIGFAKGPEKIVRYFRESELMHCRVGMLAAAGFLVQESFHPLFDGAIVGPAIEHIPQTPPWFWGILLAGVGAAETYRIDVAYVSPQEASSIDDPNTPENESSGWSNENSFTLKPTYTPGDLGFDPLGLKPKDAAGLVAMQEKELNNGRLAMLAAAGFLAQETVNHMVRCDRATSARRVVTGALTRLARRPALPAHLAASQTILDTLTAR